MASGNGFKPNSCACSDSVFVPANAPRAVLVLPLSVYTSLFSQTPEQTSPALFFFQPIPDQPADARSRSVNWNRPTVPRQGRQQGVVSLQRLAPRLSSSLIKKPHAGLAGGHSVADRGVAGSEVGPCAVTLPSPGLCNRERTAVLPHKDTLKSPRLSANWTCC